jgi:hypothetical protein
MAGILAALHREWPTLPQVIAPRRPAPSIQVADMEGFHPMHHFAKLAAVALTAFAVATSSSAASYNTSYVVTNPTFSSVSGTGDIGASLLVGDSLTVTLTAPAGQDIVTEGGLQLDYQVQTGGGSLLEDATYTYTLNNAVVASGSLVNQWACCVDIRLPLYSSPAATWDKLVYTSTIASEDGPATLFNLFILEQDGHFSRAVPEPMQTTLFAAGLLAVAIARRRQLR